MSSACESLAQPLHPPATGHCAEDWPSRGTSAQLHLSAASSSRQSCPWSAPASPLPLSSQPNIRPRPASNWALEPTISRPWPGIVSPAPLTPRNPRLKATHSVWQPVQRLIIVHLAALTCLAGSQSSQSRGSFSSAGTAPGVTATPHTFH